MMDQLDASRVERLQRLSGAAAESLLAEPLDLLFFDCTTLYFESFVADELKQPGYSKDARFKESQVLLALVVTPRGLPVSYEVLPGASGDHVHGPAVRAASGLPCRASVSSPFPGSYPHGSAPCSIQRAGASGHEAALCHFFLGEPGGGEDLPGDGFEAFPGSVRTRLIVLQGSSPAL